MIVNIVLFQIGWFACVLCAARDLPWAGTGVALVVAAIHLARAARPAEELKLIALALVIGVVWDSALVALGWITYPSGTLIAGTAPHWILAMWAIFATTLNISMRWMKKRWLIAFVLGAVCGPLSYWGAGRLGAATFTEPMAALVALALGWGVIMPTVPFVARVGVWPAAPVLVSGSRSGSGRRSRCP